MIQYKNKPTKMAAFLIQTIPELHFAMQVHKTLP